MLPFCLLPGEGIRRISDGIFIRSPGFGAARACRWCDGTRSRKGLFYLTISGLITYVLGMQFFPDSSRPPIPRLFRFLGRVFQSAFSLKILRRSICAGICAVLSGTSAWAAIYHVDFANGKNSADGLTPATAWKHAPGDKNATDKPAGIGLQPGDTVLFKGGVRYAGEVLIETSGAEGKPITYDGNSAGTYGEGRAVLDGATEITNWAPVASAEAVEGNSLWNEIWFADIDIDLASNFSQQGFVKHRDAGEAKQAPWQRLFLIDRDRSVLPIAQDPKPTDAFYPDIPADFFESETRVTTLDAQRIGNEKGSKASAPLASGGIPSDSVAPVDAASSVITDHKHLPQQDSSHYDGMFVGIHGGNNHVFFARVRAFDPAKNQLIIPQFFEGGYAQTRYAFYNSPKLLSLPGEWCLQDLGNNRTRVFFLRTTESGSEPEGIGYPSMKTGLQIAAGVSHVNVKNFLVQRYTGGRGGISVGGSDRDARSSKIQVSDCEVRFVSGGAGINVSYSSDVVVENSKVRACPGWTVGIYMNRVENFRISGNLLEKNSGSGIRHYESKKGHLYDNAVLDHFGIHSSALNFYEGCADIVFERNRVQNVIAINRNAENLMFRNNLIDGMGRANVGVAIWGTGGTGGFDVRNVQFLNNTIVNMIRGKWGGAIFGQSHVSPPGFVIKNNILDGISDELPGVIENNIYTRKVDERFMGKGCIVVDDQNLLFVDAAKGDFRLKAGSPAIGAGVPADVTDDLTGAARTADRMDVGAYQFK